MRHCPSLIALALAVTACTPLAVGAMVVGGTGLVAGANVYESDCQTEGCTMGNAFAALLGSLGLVLVGAGGWMLAIDQAR